MFKKIIITTFLASTALVAHATEPLVSSEQIEVKIPFDIKTTETPQQVAERLKLKRIEPFYFYDYSLIGVKGISPIFRVLSIWVSEKTGICAVSLSGRGYDISTSGEQLIAEFKKVGDFLTYKYGQPTSKSALDSPNKAQAQFYDGQIWKLMWMDKSIMKVNPADGEYKNFNSPIVAITLDVDTYRPDGLVSLSLSYETHDIKFCDPLVDETESIKPEEVEGL